MLNSSDNTTAGDDDEGWLNINNYAWTPEGLVVPLRVNFWRRSLMWTSGIIICMLSSVMMALAVMFEVVTVWIGRCMRLRLVILSVYVMRVITKSDDEFKYDYDVLKKIKQ